MFGKFRGVVNRVGVGAGALVAAGAASAADLDVTSVTGVLTSVAVAGALIGAAYLGTIIGIRAWKWLKSAA